MTDPAIIARLDRMEALLERLASNLPDLLTPAIRRATRGEPFLAGDLFRLAEAEDMAASATGLPRPELAESLELAAVWSAHGLARWIAAREGAAFERMGTERGGTIWRTV